MGALALKKISPWIVLASGFLILTAAHTPTRADCQISGSTATCTGDLDPVVYNSTGIDKVIVEDLTDDVEGTAEMPLVLQDDAAGGGGASDPGGAAAAIEVDFDGEDFSLLPADSQFAILAKGTGGDGHDGEEKSSGTGTNGGAGGATGGTEVEFTSGGITTPTNAPGTDIILVQSQGGNGGEGGLGENGVTSKNIGGDGGVGGAAGEAELTVITGTFDLSNTNNGFVVETIGGTGGKGGDSNPADFNSSHAGHGGAGGAAGGAVITLGDADLGLGATFTMTATGKGLVATSTGGDGGDSGEVETDGENSDGEDAGAGGASSGAEISITGGSSLEINSGSIGVLAESIGGDGGNGGEAKGGPGATNGGAGGAGGDGGTVETTVDSGSSLSVATSENAAHAILAGSLAGNGGTGGEAKAESGDAKGGDGGTGGTGGEVTVEVVSTTLTTTNNQAQGVLARSYGGAGGAGGKSSGGTSGSGGASQAPGPGGAVEVLFEGDITTGGDEANGILAQSVGGFAGDAGSASAAFVAYGASGESGGDAGDVTVKLIKGSTITTTGKYSSAIDAQSTGGGGGKGGSSSAIDALGGDGSAGGDGGTVSATAFATTITTGGEQSRGISAASHGGGGGNAGSSSGVSSIGGKGGTGGDGGTSSVTSTATITTSGDYSDGIFSSSIGGGGGSAHSTSGIVAIGGSGRDGGNGMDASVTINGGNVSTMGKNADGVFIQSIGGGGGDGSNAIAVGAEFSYAIGGSGGSGGTGGAVSFSDNVTDPYSISTTGDFSYGLFAQSVGGGGGDGGYAAAASAGLVLDFSMGASGSGGTGSDGGTVNVDTNATISTAGVNATALFAQSIGGGGGSAGTTVASANDLTGSSISLAVGGEGGNAGDGGSVTVVTHNSITTAKSNSFGILAQSVGGGGGNSGTTVAGSVFSSIGSLSIAVGGKAGAGGNGGDVSITQGGTVSTGGDNAPAIFGQSLGGGGGNSGATVAGSGFSLESINLGLGADGGSGGDGDTVTVVADDDASTTGNNSAAIIAQSIGGSGGVSGVSASGSAIDTGDVGITIGGNGGGGGNGGAVTLSVTDNNTITTKGNNSFGLLAQSIGGTGGVSGTSLTADGGSAGTVDITVQGNGGDGGSSGDVTVQNAATVNTSGTYSDAILAQSLAGGGGSATAAITVTGVSIGSFSRTVGGAGGKGGTGGTVSVENTGGLTTGGPFSTGILAQSLGGNGGNGGLAVNAGANVGTYVSGSFSDTVGGNGGDGGTAGDVVITNSGAISTSDYASLGIFAQSLGGDGGTGGSAVSGELSVTKDTSINVSFTLGGDGGDGGIGEDVTVTNGADGTITTTGGLAQGILAQSVGGNGGNGGSAYTAILDIGGATANLNVGISVGGTGGDGAVAGDVEVDNKAIITTEGVSSSGIYAQSIGGNGGNGGNAINAFGVFRSNAGQGYSGKLDVAVGGGGGVGMDSGTVTVDNTGKVATTDTAAYAILAQSVGGGGGDGGSADNHSIGASFGTGTAADAKNQGFTSFSVSAKIGGAGGAAGDGNSVMVTNSGDLETSGSAAYGIIAQSVGGGGGIGGNGQVSNKGISTGSTLDELVDILEDVKDAYGAYKDLSNLYTSWSVDVGGSGGAGGDGSDVMVQNDGNITTAGGSGTAIFAQSVGGGGGIAGDGVGGLITSVVVGGSGGDGGKGGDVTVDNTGTLSTTGDGAMGIFAHSIGGSGGSAGDIEMTFLDSFTDLNIGMGVIVQKDPGSGGDGGDVAVTTSGAIKTEGIAAVGIFAQSAGGSGGARGINGFAGAFGFVGSGQAAGNGGPVTITTTAPITVTGDYTVGIYAQSASGNTSGQTAGDIDISVGRDINASGTGGRGILAQSEGFDSNGTIAITVAQEATVSTTEEGFETIGLKDGASNTITNYGTIEKAEGATVNGYAVIADGGLLTIDNFGTFTGSVLLDNGHFNVFNNEAGATLNLGLEFDLGKNDSTLTNNGTMSPAGEGVISTSAVTGSLVQTDSGTYLVDADLSAGDADVIDVSGTADMAGTVSVQFLDAGKLSDDPQSLTIVDAAGGVSTDTQTALSVAPSAVAQLALAYPSAEEVTLEYQVDFLNDKVADGLNSNQAGIAKHIQGAFVLGTLSDGLTLLINEADVDGYAAALDQLSPEVYAFGQLSTLLSMSNFNDAMRSCGKRSAVYRFVEQGQCGWMRMQARRLEVDATKNSQEFDEDAIQLAGGVQYRIGDDWVLGGALAYEYRDLDAKSSVDSDGEQYQGGLVAKRQFGASMLSASLGGGFANYDVDRIVVSDEVAKGDQDIGFVSTQFSASHVFERGDLYIKPRTSFSIDYISMDGFNEQGAGDLNLEVNSQDDFYYSVQPAVEFGGEVKLDNGVLLRPDLTIGVTRYLGNKSPEVTARFEGSPSGVSSFTVSSDLDKTFLDIGLGMDIISTDNWIVSADGFSRFSSNTRTYGGGIKLSIPF